MRRLLSFSRSRGELARSKVLRVTMAVAGLGLVPVAVASSVTAGHDAAQADLDHALQTHAVASAAALTDYFERSTGVALLLANDKAISQLEPRAPDDPSTQPGADVAAPAHRHVAGHRGDHAAAHHDGQTEGHGTGRTELPVRWGAEANLALQYLETLYPDAISEACLIDATGTELARVVRGTIAPDSELSTEEAAAPFFSPTVMLPTGRVHQSEPYESPDTGLMVISNSTPLQTETGTTWAMVHFEVALDSFREAVLGQADTDGVSAAIVDDRTGEVVLAADASSLVGDPAPDWHSSPALADLVTSSRGTDGAEAATIADQRLAIAPVPTDIDNLNSWSVMVSTPESAAGWSRSIGPAPIAVALAALALLAFAGLNQRASTRRLRQSSLTDELTGLANRRLLTDRLTQALLLARRRDLTSAVLMIDLDRFKEVNDTLGHHYGDRLLVEVAARLTDTVRTSDTVARLGGDEFAVLLPDVSDADSAMVSAQRCLSRLHEPFQIEGVTLNIEASIGVALAPRHGDDGNALLRAADVAMYEAKDRRCGLVVYDPGHDVQSPSRLALLGDLRRALQDDELVMYYQPKVAIDTDTVCSAEALVRWQHPERGMVPPDEFIPVAESTGLILPLTLHTLDLAVAQAARWHESGEPIQIAVNLSPRCLLEVDLPAKVQSILDRHSLPARLLRLEVTETSIMTDPARALTILNALQQAGVRLSLDDFGTGYSSMSYLRRLPVDELKIDRSFVGEMLDDGNAGVLVRSSIDLGHNLGLSVVAEGVEDSETLDQLAGLGCDVVQGYHFARPMPAADLLGWLATRHDSPHEDAAAPA